MSELTEFLLARVAEDEAEVQDWPAEGNWGRYDDTRMWTDPKGHPIYAPRDRVLRECEAKRALVKHLTRLAAGGPVDKYNAADEALWCTLRVLAAVYVDHPEFRDEWKP